MSFIKIILSTKRTRNMIKQLVSGDIKNYLKSDSKKILLDVRTEGECDSYGKPDGDISVLFFKKSEKE